MGHEKTHMQTLLMKIIGSLSWPSPSIVENKTNRSYCIVLADRMALKCKINLSVHPGSTNHSEWKHGAIARGEKVHRPHPVNTNQWQLIKWGHEVNSILKYL